MNLALERFSISALLPRLQSREISALALVERCIERIDARDGLVGAWVCVDRERVRREARALDRGPVKGPLHGIPVGIKDIIDIAGVPTTCGSQVYEGRLAPQDAACVVRLRAAGAVIMGKTVTTEFSYFNPGKTANPHDLRHTPGGSSSGSAAAVADFMVPAALGAQTAGSLTRPAAYCGVVGFKSSRDAVPLDGVQPLAPSLDSLGWLVRDVEDAEITRAVLVGENYRPLPKLSKAPRIAVCETNEWHQADHETQELLHRAAERVGARGAILSTLNLPAEFFGLVECHVQVMSYEAARTLGDIVRDYSNGISPQLKSLVEAGRALTIAEYDRARLRADLAIRALDRMFDGFDAILAPSAPGRAPAGLHATGDPIFSRVWTLLQGPSVALPVLVDGALPLSVQLIGRRNQDRHLLSVAKWALGMLA